MEISNVGGWKLGVTIEGQQYYGFALEIFLNVFSMKFKSYYFVLFDVVWFESALAVDSC